MCQVGKGNISEEESTCEPVEDAGREAEDNTG